MKAFGSSTWLRSPSDREIIQKWTVGSGQGMTYGVDIPAPADPNNFEFLAFGDTGDSNPSSRMQSPQDAVAEQLTSDLALPGSSGVGEFVIHLGDVIYMTGERRLYEQNFCRPYAPIICPESTPNDLIFRLPFFPIPGNHDYYDLGAWVQWLSHIPVFSGAIRRISREVFGFAIPEGGSEKGRAFMESFIDSRADTRTGALRYQPGIHTRLPNRYYKFSVGSADFFMLDSNTLDAPPPSKVNTIAEREEANRRIAALEQEAKVLELKLKELSRTGNSNQTIEVPQDPAPIVAQSKEPKLAQAAAIVADEDSDKDYLSEKALDVQRELALERRGLNYSAQDYDAQQIEWLREAVEESVRERPDSWRIVCLHHPLFTTIGNHCEGRDVRSVRANLLNMFKENVHLVLAGHSHAFEWIRSEALPSTGLFVSGGGGQISLRRSILDPKKLFRNRDRYDALRRSGVSEVAVGGRGPAAEDGERGPVYHYLKIAVSPESLIVRPVGVRRLDAGYRRESVFPAFHAEELSAKTPPWVPRKLSGVEIKRGVRPVAVWES
ncbi:MAG: hypothetical protein ABJA67_14150 [Chthonomonadales bacterium]